VLKIIVRVDESFDETKNQFVWTEVILELEHSLVSLSKWEAEFEKPFLGPHERTDEEAMGYIRAMILTPDYPEGILDKLSRENHRQISDYIEKNMTATTVYEPPQQNGPRKKQVITSELIYYWMVKFEIPWEAENWHLNRLFMLIKVFNANDSKPKKMSPREAAEQRRRLNDERRAALKTNG
jgi:hypothetical protein